MGPGLSVEPHSPAFRAHSTPEGNAALLYVRVLVLSYLGLVRSLDVPATKTMMFECLTLGDARRLRVCERQNLLLVEFNTVSCSSRSIMEPGAWTRQGYWAPSMYHTVAGQYTLLEKQLVSDFSPGRHCPSLHVLQDSTNWHDAQLPAGWGLQKQEGHLFSGRGWGKRTASSPKAPRHHSPPYDGYSPVCRRDVNWGASHTAKSDPKALVPRGPVVSCRWNQGASAKNRRELPVRAPPSYEAHMLLRLGAQQGPRKENWPRPPPYLAPPSYEASHHTVQPQQRPGKSDSAGKLIHTGAPKKSWEREGGCESDPLTHMPGRKAGRWQTKMPGSWSYLSGARTWGGPRMQLEKAKSPSHLGSGWAISPQHRSHTLPRVNKRNQVMSMPCHHSQHTLPVGWGFSHAAGWRGPKGEGSRAKEKHCQDFFPRWKEPSPSRKLAGSQPALSKSMPRRQGGLFVIDATCVMIQAQYIPPPRMEQVCYLAQEGAGTIKNTTSPGSPGPTLMEERAARILGLPLHELGVTEAAGGIEAPRISRPHVMESGAVCGDSSGREQVKRTPSASCSPRKPSVPPTPNRSQEGPAEQEPACLEAKGTTAASPCPGSRGLLQSKEEPVPSAQSQSYIWDLKEAMSRIRRHTAPDSDTDEELEKESQSACGQPLWGERLNQEVLMRSSSSSSSLESSSSNATVVPGNATLAWRPRAETPRATASREWSGPAQE
ncbi:dendrin [Candoia aspera]|uniref:dendrin n=1 Tax=Candoia aspera TaxID=51853 RepID=UPI002FD820D6